MREHGPENTIGLRSLETVWSPAPFELSTAELQWPDFAGSRLHETTPSLTKYSEKAAAIQSIAG